MNKGLQNEVRLPRDRKMEKVVITHTKDKNRELLSQSGILDVVTVDDCIQGVSWVSMNEEWR